MNRLAARHSGGADWTHGYGVPTWPPGKTSSEGSQMSKTARDVMTPGRPPEAEVIACGAIGADDMVDEALRAMIERQVHSLSVIDGHEIIGQVRPGELAISIEDTRTWSALCS
jgi:hypothetical protein